MNPKPRRLPLPARWLMPKHWPGRLWRTTHRNVAKKHIVFDWPWAKCMTGENDQWWCTDAGWAGRAVWAGKAAATKHGPIVSLKWRLLIVFWCLSLSYFADCCVMCLCRLMMRQQAELQLTHHQTYMKQSSTSVPHELHCCFGRLFVAKHIVNANIQYPSASGFVRRRHWGRHFY